MLHDAWRSKARRSLRSAWAMQFATDIIRPERNLATAQFQGGFEFCNFWVLGAEIYISAPNTQKLQNSNPP